MLRMLLSYPHRIENPPSHTDICRKTLQTFRHTSPHSCKAQTDTPRNLFADNIRRIQQRTVHDICTVVLFVFVTNEPIIYTPMLFFGAEWAWFIIRIAFPVWSRFYMIALMSWASCLIRKIVGCACAWNAGNVSPAPRDSDPDMHHGTCVTHVPRCMLGSLTSGFLLSQWREKRSQHSLRMRNPQYI